MSGLVTPAFPGSQGKRDGVLECRSSTISGRSHGHRRVLVLDGDLLVAEAIVSALAHLNFDARFAMPTTPAHVRDLSAWEPGLVLLDVDTVEHRDCVALVAMLSEANVPVAVMSSRLDGPVIADSIDAGATTVVNKGWALDELAAVITRLFAGIVVLDEEAKRQLLEPIRRQVRAKRERLAPFDALTHGEQRVLAELLEGHAPEAIARNRSVSILTVRSQIKSILQKLGVNSQLAAVSLALRAGWTLEEPHAGEGRLRRPVAIAELDVTA